MCVRVSFSLSLSFPLYFGSCCWLWMRIRKSTWKIGLAWVVVLTCIHLWFHAPKTILDDVVVPGRNNRNEASATAKETATTTTATTTVFRPTTSITAMATSSEPPTTQKKSQDIVQTTTTTSDSAAQVVPSSSSTATLHVNNAPFEPPSWMKSYIQFHQSAVKKLQLRNGPNDDDNSKSPSAKVQWLQWYCNWQSVDGKQPQRHCGGLADRIKGMLEALILAKVDHRVVLLEEWEGTPSTGPHPLTDYLQPNAIAWNMTLPSSFANSNNSTTEISEFPTFTDSFGASKSPEQLIVKKAPCTFSSSSTGIRFTGNLLSAEDVLTDAKTCQGQFGSDPWQGPLYAYLFWTMFQFTPRVHAHADVLRGPVHRNYYVAAHVRTGNFTAHYADKIRQASTKAWDTFADCVDAVARALHEKCGTVPPVYLASDNDNAKRYIQSKVASSSNKTIHVQAPDIEMMHIDLHSEEAKHKNDDDHATAGYLAVWAELKILIDSTCIITSESGFSKMGKALSRQYPRCTIAYDRCANPDKVAKKVRYVTCPGE